MTGTGTVVAVNGKNAVVEVVCKSACGHNCTECGACNAPIINTEAENPIGAVVGDKVEFCSSTSQILGAAFMLYIFPLIAVISICAATEYFFSNTAVNIIAFFGAAALWIFAARYFGKSKIKKSVIVKLLKD